MSGADVVNTTRRLSGTTTRAQAYILMVGVVLALGLNWPLINRGLDSVTPWWFVVLRMGGAAIVIWLFNAITGRLQRVNPADLPVVLSVALGRLTIMTGMVFVALQFVDAGRSAVLVWTASLWTVPPTSSGWPRCSSISCASATIRVARAKRR